MRIKGCFLKDKFITTFAVIVLLNFGCNFNKNFNNKEEKQLYIQVLQDIINNKYSVKNYKKPNEIDIYISLGGITENSHVDPPLELIRDLNIPNYQFFSASKAILPSDNIKLRLKFKGIRNRKTGKPGVLYFLNKVTWKDENTVVIEVGEFRKNLAGHGYSALYKKKKGKWVLKKIFSDWVS